MLIGQYDLFLWYKSIQVDKITDLISRPRPDNDSIRFHQIPNRSSLSQELRIAGDHILANVFFDGNCLDNAGYHLGCSYRNG